MFFFKIPTIFKRKPAVKVPEKLDKHSEASYALAVATLKVMAICDKYGQKGMSAMAGEINRQVGDKILHAGQRRGWK
jgi:hypothetical protein